MNHHPTLYATRRYGCWATCVCGWRTARDYRAVFGAHLEFGRHLLDAARHPQPDSPARDP